MNRPSPKALTVLVGLITLAVATRMVMWLPNFHAVTAATLFAGVYFRSRFTAALVPVVAMSLSNWIIGGYALEIMLAVYAALLLPLALRGWLRANLSPSRVVASAVASSVIFYLATNAAVWYVGAWYPRSLEGLAACYAAALPFFWNAVAGDLAFSALLFGSYALGKHFIAAHGRMMLFARQVTA